MGGDLRLRAEDDLYLAGLEYIGLTAARSIDLAAAEGVYFGASTSERWALADNSRKRLGIGTLDPSNRLHVVSNDRQSVFTMIEGTHSHAVGTGGPGVKTPQNMWELSMDTYLNFNFPDGALSLHRQNGATQA